MASRDSCCCCESVKLIRGVSPHVIRQQQQHQSADENGGNALVFLLASYERGHYCSLKRHTSLLLIAAQAVLFLSEESTGWKPPRVTATASPLGSARFLPTLQLTESRALSPISHWSIFSNCRLRRVFKSNINNQMQPATCYYELVLHQRCHWNHLWPLSADTWKSNLFKPVCLSVSAGL